MPIRDDFLKMLQCQLSRRPLARADDAVLSRLNELVATRKLRNRAGEPVEDPLEEGLVESVSGWLYPVRNGVPQLLSDEAISLADAGLAISTAAPIATSEVEVS